MKLVFHIFHLALCSSGLLGVALGAKICLPPTTTNKLVHGICGKGVSSFSASSSMDQRYYTPVDPFEGELQGWDNKDYTIVGMEDTPCGGGTFLRSNNNKNIDMGTEISIDYVPTNGEESTICVFVTPDTSRDGGFSTTLEQQLGFTDYGTNFSEFKRVWTGTPFVMICKDHLPTSESMGCNDPTPETTPEPTPAPTPAPEKVCPTGETSFLLGASNNTILRSGRGKFMQDHWRFKLNGNSRKKTRARPIDIGTMEKYGRIGWQVVADASGPDHVIGIGIAHENIRDYEDPGDGAIQHGEGVDIRVAGYTVSSLTFGVHLLNAGERGRWMAYNNRKMVAEDIFGGEETEASDPDGKISFDISVLGGFNRIVFTVDNSAPQSAYLLEYIEGCYDPQSAPKRGTQCKGPSARFSGDPHFTSFDDIRYDCQARGEVIIAKNDDFEVQARFVVGSDEKSYVTVGKAAVFSFREGPKFQVNVPEENDPETCDYAFYVNDQLYDLEGLGTGSSEVTATFDGTSVLFHFPNSGDRIEVNVKASRNFGCVMSLQLCLSDGASGVTGLFGTPNDDETDDWTYPNNTVATIPSDKYERRFQPSLDYCKHWCVSDSETLFKYTEGTEYLEYNKDCMGDYDDTLRQKMDAIPVEVKEICEDSGLNDEDEFSCKLDGVAGDASDAYVFIESEEELDDLKDDPPAPAPAPSPSPEIEPSQGTRPPNHPTPGGVSGDPHFTTWAGDHYDYHGLCDLVLLQNPDFADGLGLDIHIRTKKFKQWSYVSNVAIQIENDILEVTSGTGTGAGAGTDVGVQYWISYVAGDSAHTHEKDTILPYTIAGYPIIFRRLSPQSVEFTVDLGDDTKITIQTWKKLVRVDIHGATNANFGTSLGLMGSYHDGKHMSRDNKTILENINEFGQEWQVRADEPKLFHNADGVQHPKLCQSSTVGDMKRRLGHSLISQEEAELACAYTSVSGYDLCVFDVMATGDFEVAEAYRDSRKN